MFPYSLCWEDVHCIWQAIREQSLFESQQRSARYPHRPLRRGAPRSARLSLRGQSCPRRPPPPPPQKAAAMCLPAPPSRAPRNSAEREALAERYYHRSTTVLSVIRRRALSTVADRGISMWLPDMLSRPVVNVLL